MNTINTNQKISFLHLLKSIYQLDIDSSLKLESTLEQYISILNKMVTHRGKNEAVKVLKAYYQLCVKQALGIKYENLPMMKADKTGYPKCFHLIKPYLMSSLPWEKQLGLTIAKLYLSITLEVKPDIDPIRNPCTGVTVLSKKWQKFLRNCFCKNLKPKEID